MLGVWFCLTVPTNSLQTIPFSRKSIATRQQARRLLPVPCGKAPDGCYETRFGRKIAGLFGFWGDNKASKEDVWTVGGTGEKAALASGLGSALPSTPSMLVASVFSSIKGQQNSLPQIQEVWGRGSGTLTQTQTKGKSEHSSSGRGTGVGGVEWGAPMESSPSQTLGVRPWAAGRPALARRTDGTSGGT